MEQRDFLGDEVHMMQNDLKVLRQENQLLKLKVERQDEALDTFRSENAALKSTLEGKTIELASLQSVLESVGQLISSGLERYVKRRELKRETVKIVSEGERFLNETSTAPQTTTLIKPKPGGIDDHPLLPKLDINGAAL